MQTAKKLGCKLKSTYPLQVDVANGNKMYSNYVCKGFTWSIQGQFFSSDVMTIPLGGCEMVLGIKWLSTLGNIQWNFDKLRMEFMCGEQKKALRGTAPNVTKWVDGKKMDKGTNRAEPSSLLVYVFPSELMSVNVPSQDSQEQQQLNSTPITLPPKRSHDHQIVLQSGMEPVNIRPYRHPLSQKHAIEQMVKEMLET